MKAEVLGYQMSPKSSREGGKRLNSYSHAKLQLSGLFLPNVKYIWKLEKEFNNHYVSDRDSSTDYKVDTRTRSLYQDIFFSCYQIFFFLNH